MTVRDLIHKKLSAHFSPQSLVVEDESHRHAGHAGARPGGETHFKIIIVAETFKGLSRIERQKKIHAVLSAELAGPIHALSITARAPGES